MCDTMAKIFDNYAIFAKNSDRSPNEPQVVEYFEAKVHSDKKVKTTYIEVDQLEKTNASDIAYSSITITLFSAECLL